MLTLYLFLAATVEAVNELTFGRLFGENKVFPQHGWALPFTSLAFAVFFGYVAELRMIAWATNVIAGVEFHIMPVADHFISGVLISAGGRYLHQFLSRHAPENSIGK